MKNPRAKFGQAAKAANVTCHRTTNSVGAYKTCMSREMKQELRDRGFKIGGKKRRGRKSRRR